MTDFVLEISYRTDSSTDDEVQSRLFLTSSSGSSSTAADATTTVSAYFDSPAQRDEAMESFRGINVQLRQDDRPRVNWLERYQQSLEPLFIGKSFVVAPDAALIADTNRHTIVVPQEQAFGTGSHETTWLCIEMLETIDMAGRRGLDIGSGSGILAIAMLRLGASKATAFDNDTDAYGALRDNRIRNGVDERAMRVFIGSVEALRGGRFDVVTMNIIPEVIIPLLPEVAARVGGDLILSGILNVRRDDVIASAARWFTLVAESSRGEWWCGRFQRGSQLAISG